MLCYWYGFSQDIYETICAIRYYLYNLKKWKQPYRSVNCSKVQASLLYGWVFFTFSKMYNGTKSCKASRTCSLLWINPLLPNAPFQSPWKHKRAFLQKSLTAVNYFRKKVFWYFQGYQKGKFERKELTNVLILNQWRQYETYLGLQ